MPRSLSKVSKLIHKKKGKNATLHENSRDCLRLQRAALREGKISKLVSARERQNRPYLERATFFQNAISSEEKSFSVDQINRLIERYIQRNHEELFSLKSDRRSGRPPNPKELILKQKVEKEEMEFISGFWMPDIQSPENLRLLRNWNGEWIGLNVIKFIRYSKDGSKTTAAFPPQRGS